MKDKKVDIKNKFKVKFVYSDSPDAQRNLDQVFEYLLGLNPDKDIKEDSMGKER